MDKSLKLVILNFCAQTIPWIPCRPNFYINKASSKAKHFIHSDILVPVSEFVVVVILSEWWLVPTTAGTSLLYVTEPVKINHVSTKNP